MKQNYSTRRDFLKASAVGAGSLLFSGCNNEVVRDSGRGLKNLATKLNPPTYSTNVSNKLSKTEFSDKYFNSRNCVSNINGKEYVWMPLEQYNVRLNEEKALSADDYFPFAGFQMDKILVKVDEDDKTITYQHEDGTASIFVRQSVRPIKTGFRADLGREKTKPGQIIHTSEPRFNVPSIDFGIPGFRKVAYVQERNTGQIVLIPQLEYGINSKGTVIYFPKDDVAFVETTGNINLKPAPKKPVQPSPIEVKVEKI